VIVVHGMGVHPDWNLIGVLRNGLADAGYTTLSIQMPVLGNDAKPEDYPPTFPEAAQRIEAACAFLQAKGYGKIALVSHSMGSRMSDYYLEHAQRPPIAAWVAIGLAGPYAGLGNARFPVLDLYGENDLPAVLQSAPVRGNALKNMAGAQQIMAPGTDHFFNDKDQELVATVRGFLDKNLFQPPQKK
jgi:pimeloyl-ACP methyl ester carboxylesterase